MSASKAAPIQKKEESGVNKAYIDVRLGKIASRKQEVAVEQKKCVDKIENFQKEMQQLQTHVQQTQAVFLRLEGIAAELINEEGQLREELKRIEGAGEDNSEKK
uniref:Uncharacterized protein n=1 Tax=viral metagenome TaxID=1070528 RepID=A0A6M3KFV0_9ZZZZ